MTESTNTTGVPEEVVLNKIFEIRNQKVMLDRDLAELYGVETKALKQAVKRNLKRFPKDFMFEMTVAEMQAWRNEFASSSGKKGLRYSPFCFTEQGVAMLSSVLNSDRAIQVNIQIIRVFTKLRNLLATQRDVLLKLEQLEKKELEQDEKILLIFKYLKQLEQVKQEETEYRNRPRIGFKRTKEE
jgi:phage regulator Rha-like protein